MVARPFVIGALVAGVPARIDGRVVAGEAVRAPGSGAPCVAYVCHIGEATFRRGWVEHAVEIDLRPFRIRDDTGEVEVIPYRPALHLGGERHVDLDEHHPLLRRYSIPYYPGVQAREQLLLDGDRVSIVGIPVAEPDPDGAAHMCGPRGDAPLRLVVSGSSRAPLVIRVSG